jgi:hypothetical protein
MARNTRTAIPGRAPADVQHLDRLVFGPREDEAPDEVVVKDEREFADRAGRERRRVARRKTDFSPLPDDRGYRPPEDNKRGLLILALAVTVVGVFGAVVWNAYSDGVRSPDGAATPSLASSGPFKKRPESVEAETGPEVEASVFERVESGPRPAAETAAAEAESTPEVRPDIPPPALAAKPDETPAAVAGAPAAPAPIVAAPAAAAPKPAAPSAVAQAASSPAAPSPAAPSPAPSPAASGGYAPAFSSGGGFVVQVAAPSTESAALAEWEKRKKAMPELFAGAERFVVRADVNGKTVYRVRAGSFATAADADAFCGAIKAKGGDCYRTAR